MASSSTAALPGGLGAVNGRLDGKTVLVTAAAAGIGRASAIRMASEGARVIATDIDVNGLELLPSELPIEKLPLDVTDVSALRALASARPTIDVLFNCAGIVPSGTVLDCSLQDWSSAFSINVTSCFLMIQAFLPGMLTRGQGSIINMASVASSIKGVPNRFAYGATKAAVIGITKSVAADFVGKGIRCNAICPGTVDTPSLQKRLSATGDYDKARREFEARQPMGRLGRAEEIAGLVAFLASDEASFITGQAYAIDGGWS
ncbi:MAG TPA: SDR family oxidoreductase [Steroidobacteraceae bacterium]|nr:SDR family oxidoreductase [Steroidobacteraceae bacterium]